MKLSSRFFVSLSLVATPLVVKDSNPMFPPPAIEADENYRDWYGPTLKRFKEKPLWVGNDTTSARETIRLTFISGASLLKGRSATVIRIETRERHTRLLARAEFLDHGHREIREVANKNVLTSQVDTLQKLADDAGAWKFPVGTWEKEDEISVHCTELIMERQQGSDYAVSHILISCNQPSRLMPFVDYVAKLAGQNGKLRY